MNKHAFSALLFAGLAVLAPASRLCAAESDQAQIEQVIARFQAAIVAHDQKGLEALFVPEGGAWFEVLGENAYRRIKARKPELSRVHADNYHHFAALMGGATQAIEEKFDHVRVHTDGAVASVYFDFVFLIDGKRNNVGSETWQLVHTGDGWKISAMAYSSYPDRAR
jgi:ketosteroid isomerase-like protein